MPRSPHLAALVVSAVSCALALAACGPASPPAAAPAGSTCAERTRSARSEVLAVLGANLACASDADCVAVGVGSACFDACSHAGNAKGASAVRDAAAKVDSTICATFKQDGCRFDVPPCAPPRAPRCNQGKCEM